jgi:hypothetical protein
MFRRTIQIVFSLILLPLFLFAQQNGQRQQSRILILLDGSSSMINSWSGGKDRFHAASEIILKLMDSVYHVNKDVEFSLRVYGHQHSVAENDCYDTRNEVMFSKDNYTQMQFRLESLQPLGLTPIAYSLQQAAENDLVNEQAYAYSIVLITDGGESCGGDLCEVVKTLIQHKVYFRPYIVSLVDYAPLRGEYACMGSYLQVTTEKDIPKTVGIIVDSFKPMLTLSKDEYKQIANILVNPPSVQKVKIPTVKIAEPEPVKPKKIDSVVKVAKPLPVVEPPITPPKPPTPPVVEEKKHVIKEIKEDTVKPLPKEKLTIIAHNTALKKLPLAFLVDSIPGKQVPTFVLPKSLSEKTELPQAAPKNPVIPKPATETSRIPGDNTKYQSLNSSVEAIDASETTLEVYLTDPKKEKFYKTSPQITLIDVQSGKKVKQFFRTIDASGNPDPQKDIPSGTYYLVMEGKNEKFKLNRTITIDAKMRISVYVIVNTGTLHFEYEGNPDKVVEEFSAIVVQRLDAGGKQMKQKCSMDLNYDPGNYFIEINTLPASRRNADVEFGSQTVIHIPVPGWVQFTNTNNMGKISLYCALGDKYVRFYGMEINGTSQETQKLKLQPGTYQVHFMKDPNIKFSNEEVMTFRVKSNETTIVELK